MDITKTKMSLIQDAFSGLYQGCTVLTSIIAFFLALIAGGYSLHICKLDPVIICSFLYFLFYSGKSIYDYGYNMAKLKREVDRLDSETDQLEQEVDNLTDLKDNLDNQLDELKETENSLKKITMSQKKTLQENKKENTRLHKQLTKQDKQIAERDDQLEKNAKLLEKQKTMNELLTGEVSKLHGVTIRQKKLLDQQSSHLQTQMEQTAELERLLENSKKMVTNLILAGDDYKKFNGKFGKKLTQLGDTANNLKTHTELLGKIANSLAKHVPEQQIHNVEIVEEVVKSNRKKEKLANIVAKKQAAKNNQNDNQNDIIRIRKSDELPHNNKFKLTNEVSDDESSSEDED